MKKKELIYVDNMKNKVDCEGIVKIERDNDNLRKIDNFDAHLSLYIS